MSPLVALRVNRRLWGVLVSSGLCLSALGCVLDAPAPRVARAVDEPGLPRVTGPVGGNPLEPIGDFARMLEKAMNAMLGGTSPPVAFAPMLVDARMEVLKSTLGRAKVHSVRLLFQELEITFHPPVEGGGEAEESGPVTMVKLGVAPWPSATLGQVVLTTLADGPAYRRDRALAAYLGGGSSPGTPLGRVALGVLREVRAGRCGKLPLVDPAAWSSLLPSLEGQAGLAKDTRRARQTLAPACGRMGGLLRHRINLMPDDMIFGALSPSGALLGMVRCDPDWQGTPPRLRIRSCIFFTLE